MHSTDTVALGPEHEGEFGLAGRMWLRVVDGRLRLYSDWYGREVGCMPVDSERFACAWGWFSFAYDDEAKVTGINWTGQRLIPKLSQGRCPYIS